MSGRRRFNRSERMELYVAADGHCSECGTPLLPGWHADHVQPHSRHGVTDLINGQALCPICNWKKGNRVSELRGWQQEAKGKFIASGKRDFLVSATPGSGKTYFALDLARELIASGQVERVVVVVPSDTLRQQWADNGDAFGIPLTPVSDPADYDKPGYRGCVVTYQQLRHHANRLRMVTRVPTLFILDEIHHAGDQRAWGEDLQHAAEHATFRLALTGTPWRRDKHSPIPFVEYDDKGRVKVDHPYEYGEAVADGVCRPIEFHAYDGNAKWRDPLSADPLVSADLTEVSKDDTGIALDTVFAPSSPWMRTLLAQAVAALNLRREEVPDSGGLVVADNGTLAKQYAVMLREITGEEPDLVLHDIPGSKDIIEGFRESGKRWIVAVRMVSEGVDIKRLAVGVYATKARTPLIFRQIVGRFVRTRTDADPNSLLFIPAVREFVDLAREIEEELRHQLEEELERLKVEQEQLPLSIREGISASEAKLDRAILKGTDLTADEIAAAQAECARFGIPLPHAAAVARMLRERGQQPAPAAPVVIKPDAEPRHRRERLLRGQVESLARRVANRSGFDYREVNTQLLRDGFPARGKCGIDDLEAVRNYLEKWLASL